MQRPDDAAARVDGYATARQAAVEHVVVRRLDAGLADDLAWPRARVAALVQLARVDLAEQPEELAPERSAWIPTLRQHRDVEPAKRRRPLVEVEREPSRWSRDRDRGRERRAAHAAPDVRDQLPRREVRESRELPQARGPDRGRRPPTLQVGRASWR